MDAENTQDVAAILSELYDANIVAIDGGFGIKDTRYGAIAVNRMIFNWRIVRHSTPLTYDRGWCYFGTDLATLLRAVDAALKWDGADDTAPIGYDKDVFARA
jgi:hypothetical protein